MQIKQKRFKNQYFFSLIAQHHSIINKIYKMDRKNMMESQQTYLMEHQSGNFSLNILNSINHSQKPDQDSIFYESQSQKNYSENFFHSNNLLEVKNTYQDNLYQVLAFPNLIDQNQQRSERMPEIQHPSDSEYSQQFSEIEIGRRNQSSTAVMSKKGKSILKPQKVPKTKKIDREKNMFPNIAKRNSKIIFEDCKKVTQAYFQKRNISFSRFEANYLSLLQSNGSGLSLHKYFLEKEGQLKEMSRLFVRLFEKYLRKHYMIVTLKKGKMVDLESYISTKNRELMYFSEYLKNYQKFRQ